MRSLSARIQALEKRQAPDDTVIMVYPLPNGKYPSPQDRYWIMGTDEVVSWGELGDLPDSPWFYIWDIPTPDPDIPK